MNTGNTSGRGVARLVGGFGVLSQRAQWAVPPTQQARSKPAWQVGEVRWASRPHPPTRRVTTPRGMLPVYAVSRDQLSLSHKPTASVRAPFSL